MQIMYQAPIAALGLGAAFSVVYGVADPMAALAAVQQVEAEGYYTVGDGLEERLDIAQQRAIANATQAASEKAGVFVESFSASQKGELTRDEVRAIAATVLDVKEPTKVIPEVVANGQAIRYHAYVVALVDTANVEEFLQKGKAELANAVYRNNIMEEELAKIQWEVESLKEQYRQAQEEEQRRLNEQMKRNNAEFEAMEWYKKGYAFLIMSWEEIEAYVEQYHPQDVDVTGLNYREMKRYSDAWAKECFEQAIGLNPDFSLAWRELAFIYLRNEAPEKAIETYQKAVSLAPRDTWSWYYFGCAYGEIKQYDKDLECMRKITEIDPDNRQHWTAAALRAITKIYNDQGRRGEAEAIHAYEKLAELYRRELELTPNDVALLANLGYTYYDLERYAEALPFFENILKIDPDHRGAKKCRDSILEKI